MPENKKLIGMNRIQMLGAVFGEENFQVFLLSAEILFSLVSNHELSISSRKSIRNSSFLLWKDRLVQAEEMHANGLAPAVCGLCAWKEIGLCPPIAPDCYS